jgi:hypothetical protein
MGMRWSKLSGRGTWRGAITALVAALVFGALSASSYAATALEDKTATPPIDKLKAERQAAKSVEPAKIAEAIERGVKFLLADQRPDGGWGSPEKTKGLNIYAPPPGAHDAFKSAVTSLAVMALIEAEPRLPEARRADVAKAIEHGSEWLDKHLPEVRRATPDALYNVWGHAYSIQALVKLHERAAGNAELQAKWK